MTLRRTLLAPLALAAWVCASPSLLTAQAPAEPAAKAKAKARAKPEPGSKAERKVVDLRITPDAKLPHVLLLGDSISIGYHLAAREMLAGKANVFRPVNPRNGGAENCSDSSNGVAKIDAWLAMQPKWDVIHFNWGLHDIKHMIPGTNEISTDPNHAPLRTLEEYKANLQTIIGKLKATGAKLIFCTTTPVAPGTTKPFRSNADVLSYNAAAVEIAKAHSLAIDDLYTFANAQLDKIQLPQNVHFTPEGSKVLASQVTKVISEALAK